MSKEYYMVQGDEEPVIRLRVEHEGSAVDLSDWDEVTLEYSRDAQTWTPITGGACEEVAGWWYVLLAWPAGATDELEGGYLVRFRVTRENGNGLTIPSRAPWVQLFVAV